MESQGRRRREASPTTPAAVIPSRAQSSPAALLASPWAPTSLTAQHRKETAADHPSGSPGRPQDNTWARGVSSQSGQNCPAQGSPRLLATDGSQQQWNCSPGTSKAHVGNCHLARARLVPRLGAPQRTSSQMGMSKGLPPQGDPPALDTSQTDVSLAWGDSNPEESPSSRARPLASGLRGWAGAGAQVTSTTTPGLGLLSQGTMTPGPLRLSRPGPHVDPGVWSALHLFPKGDPTLAPIPQGPGGWGIIPPG